jgi:hypothetical protein
MSLATAEAAMFLTNDFRDFEDILAAEGMSEDIMDNCELVSLPGMGTEQLHDLCKDYTTED